MKLGFLIRTVFGLALFYMGQSLSFAQAANQELGVTQLLVDGRPVKLSRDGINGSPSDRAR